MPCSSLEPYVALAREPLAKHTDQSDEQERDETRAKQNQSREQLAYSVQAHSKGCGEEHRRDNDRESLHDYLHPFNSLDYRRQWSIEFQATAGGTPPNPSVEGEALRTQSLKRGILAPARAYRVMRTERSIWWNAPS